MRALFTSTQGAGHFNPLVPFARAFERAGHEVMFAGPPALGGPVEAAGSASGSSTRRPKDELGAIWARVPELPPDDANLVVIGEIFGRLNTTAALRSCARPSRSGARTWCCATRTSTPVPWRPRLHARPARPRGHLPGLE